MAITRDSCITVVGWLFDFFTVLISVTDVVSDVLVAMQFRRDGHDLWWWLVIGGFINSSIVYATILSIVVFDEYNDAFKGRGNVHILPPWAFKLPGVVRFLLMLPLSQLAPVGMYVLQMFVMPRLRDGPSRPPVVRCADQASHLLGGASVSLKSVHAEETGRVQGTVTVVGRLQKALKQQLVTHGMLFAETIVESIPQSIIQLLAISFLGSPSTLQVVSMALAILSVVSKAYFLSLSCSIRVFVFKFCVVSFDVMSMFYIFATVLSQQRTQQVGVFIAPDDVRISYLSNAWCIKLVAMTCFTSVLALFGLAVLLIAEQLRDGNVCTRAALTFKNFRLLCVCVFGVAMLTIPVVLAQEAAKLTWSLFFFLRWEPRMSMIPAASILYGFLDRSGVSQEEQHERVVHLLRSIHTKQGLYTYSDNNLCVRFRLTTPFLYDWMEALATAEEKIIAKHRDAKDIVDRERNREASACNSSGATRTARRARESILPNMSMWRTFTPISNAYHPTEHPLGYLHNPTGWTLHDDDVLVSNTIFQEVLAPHTAALALRSRGMSAPPGDVSGTQSSAAVSSDRKICSYLVATLRDREVHAILEDYRAACRTFRGTNDGANADGTARNEVPRPTTGQAVSDADEPWATALLSVWAPPEDVMAADSYEERVHRWKFERVFHPTRLAYFWEHVHIPEPPIDHRPLSGYSAERPTNLAAYLFWVWFPVNVLCNGAFSIAVMFVSYASDFHQQNLLQQFCFWTSILFLTVAVGQLPAVWRYWALLKPIATVCEMLRASNGSDSAINEAQDAVVSYYDVPTNVIVADCVPTAVLPDDLRSVVCSLLGPHVDKSELSVADCVTMKRRHRGMVAAA